MNLANRSIKKGRRLNEVEHSRLIDHMSVLTREIQKLPYVIEAWFKVSESSEACYFMVITDKTLIKFSVRNHKSKAVTRQYNFYLSNYYNMRKLKQHIMQWLDFTYNKL